MSNNINKTYRRNTTTRSEEKQIRILFQGKMEQIFYLSEQKLFKKIDPINSSMLPLCMYGSS